MHGHGYWTIFILWCLFHCFYVIDFRRFISLFVPSSFPCVSFSLPATGFFNKLELSWLHNAAARLVTGLRRTEHITLTLKSLHWLPIRQRAAHKLAALVHKCVNGRAPEYLAEFCHPSVDRRPGMRSADSVKHADVIWWQIIRRRWSTHLEQSTWRNPRFVSDIVNVHKTVKILFACLTAAAIVILYRGQINVLGLPS